MNIKSKISKLVSGLLCFSMIFSNALPAYAADAVITENTLDGEDLSVNEKNLEDVTVTYKQASSFFVTIPKTIVLDGWKQSTYSVKVSGDIGAEQCVYVAPVDGIADTENIDFYMKDQASENAKDNVVASVTHNKFHWSSAEVAAGHKQADNLVEAPDLTAGAWRGIFQMEIKLETHVTHRHNYVETITKEPTCTEAGEKTYTCDCGDSYTEEIPAKGHNFEDGECTDCGEKDPDYHKHSYTETITKEPTCTEKGEKKYTCGCGDSYMEEIPAKGHNFVDGECTDCGEKDSDYHKHSYTETITKEPTCTETGEKTYTCDCGDSYTEEIPATRHHYGDDDKCTDCGELNPAHRHSYTESVTKEPTCTEVGEKTYTCGCGDSYTEEIPALGHNFVDGECERCHEKDPCAESHTDENGDGICDICGHEHQWVENEDVLEWTRRSNNTAWMKNGDTFTTTVNVTTTSTTNVMENFTIDVPMDVECEYTFTCPYLNRDDSMYYDHVTANLYDLDDAGNNSNPQSVFKINGAHSGSASGKIA